MRRIARRWFWNHHSIKWNMAIAFSLLIIFSVNLVGYLSYYKHSKGAEENARIYAYDIVNQVSRNTEYYIRYMEDISTLTYFNKQIQTYLNEYVNPDDYNQQIRRTLEAVKITEFFNSFLSIRKDIVSIYIFGNDGQVLTSRPNIVVKDYLDIREQNWYQQAKQARGSIVLSSTHVQNFMKEDHHWVISLSREINHLDTKKSLGVFLIDLNFKVIQEICDNIQLGRQSGYMFIVDQNGGLIYHPQQQSIYSKVKQEDFDLILDTSAKFVTSSMTGREKLYTISTSEYTGWKVVGVNYTDEMVPNKVEFRNFIIALSIVSLPFTLLLAMFIASRISRPINRLEQNMKQVEKGDFDVEIEIKGQREVAQLSRTFQLMLKRIKELMSQVVEEQELKRKSELKALQAQINPHFLYNTLDLAIWMTQRGKSKEVIQLISSLSKLFRLSISKGDSWISVKDEVEHVKHYLLIQKLRYKDKLAFIIDVEQSILRNRIPRLILQPLVENAIYHGIKFSPNEGYVQIRGYRADLNNESVLIIEVRDNGIGMTPEKLKGIFEGHSSKLQGGGVGVKNIHERIQLYSGPAYGLRYESVLNEGTTARIVLPLSFKADLKEDESVE